jgi:hypothetical protein
MSTHGPTPEVSDSVADILRAAYSYGLADGHAVVNPALVLVAAARNEKTLAWPMLGPALAEARPLLAADVSASAPTHVAGAEPAAATGVPALREARWWVLRDNDKKLRARGITATPGWDTGVAEALEQAAHEAAPQGAACIGVAAFLLGLLRSSHPAVHSLAKTVNLDIAAAASELQEQRPWAPEKPFTPLADTLPLFGVVDRPTSLPERWYTALIRRISTSQKRWSGPILVPLETEILRQTVMTNQPSVQAAHLPLAIVSMQEQLTANGTGLAADFRDRNQGGNLLTQRGLDLRAAQHATENLPPDDDVLTPSDVQQRLMSSGKLGDPSWTHAAATAMDHAADIARRHQHRDTGTTHLLAAVLTDANSTASRLLESLGIDTASLRDDLDQQLRTLPRSDSSG